LPVVAELGFQDRGAWSRDGQASALEVRDIQRAYGTRQALAGVDLDLQSGEIYGLLGPNGAGKTSLVRAISGRLRLDAGSVRLNGKDPLHSSAVRRFLGLVPQDVALYPDLSCRENLEVFGRLMGLSRGDARSGTRRLLNLVGLSDRAGDRVATLSGGMKRRLNVAAGVIHHPKVLLLDEPTVGVDPSAREDIHELLLELRREGLAILLTTHDLEQASELCDRVGILIDGRLRVEGRVADLVHEIFGDGKELLVALADAPQGAGLAELETAGLEPSRDQRLWTGLLERGLDDLSAFAAELERAGLEVEEVRVREPSLRGVFFQLAGREIDE
jgi:ABC-2 type transport system ATP-binding protein